MQFRISNENSKKLAEQYSLRERSCLVFLILGLMATSGMPLFLDNKPFFILYFVYCIACAWYFGVFVKPYFYYALLALFVLFLQIHFFGLFYLGTAILQLMIIITGIVTLAVIGINFIDLFLKIMAYIAVISLILFIPVFIFPGLFDILINYFPIHFKIDVEHYGIEQTTHSLLLINFTPDFSYRPRNIGPFWEAGVYGGFLTLSLIFNTIKNNRLFNPLGILFIITLISTISTSSYLALATFIGLYLTFKLKNLILKIFIFATFSVSFSVLYNNFEILGNKISEEIDTVKIDALRLGGSTRMASAYLDIKEIQEHEFYIFFGRGSHPDTRVAGYNKRIQRNNGITDLLSRWGIIIFVVYLFLLIRSFISVCKYYGESLSVALLAVLVIYIMAFSEPYFRFGFFWATAFLFIPFGAEFRARCVDSTLKGYRLWI